MYVMLYDTLIHLVQHNASMTLFLLVTKTPPPKKPTAGMYSITNMLCDLAQINLIIYCLCIPSLYQLLRT